MQARSGPAGDARAARGPAGRQEAGPPVEARPRRLGPLDKPRGIGARYSCVMMRHLSAPLAMPGGDDRTAA
jgi:hypothetical protein